MSDNVINGPMQADDWKLYREIRPQMTERFFGTLLAQIQELLNESGSSNSERFNEISSFLKDQKPFIADVTKVSGRSNAFLEMACMDAQGLMTEEELARFSKEARTVIQRFRAMRAENRKHS